MTNWVKHQISWKKIAWVMLGLLLYALTLDLFLVGNNIAAGGLSGVAIVLHQFIPMEIPLIMLLLNIPVLLAAQRMRGWKYTLLTLGNTLLYSLVVKLGAQLPTITYDPMVASIFGGICYGMGIVALALGNGSTGGTDLICRLLVRRFPKISLGKMVLLVEGSVILFAMIAFQNIELGLYAVITIAVSSFTADRLLLGIDRGCICMIVTAGDQQAIAEVLMTGLRRAVTQVNGQGMYTQTPRSILYIAVRPKETILVKSLLSQVDPNAFVMVIPANEVLGGTFRAKASPL